MCKFSGHESYVLHWVGKLKARLHYIFGKSLRPSSAYCSHSLMTTPPPVPLPISLTRYSSYVSRLVFTKYSLTMAQNLPLGIALYSDVEKKFRDLLPSNFLESDDLFESTDETQAYTWIQTCQYWTSASQTLRFRIAGMMQTCKGFISAVQISQLIPADFRTWPALVLGSLALCIRVSRPLFTLLSRIHTMVIYRNYQTKFRKCFQ